MQKAERPASPATIDTRSMTSTARAERQGCIMCYGDGLESCCWMHGMGYTSNGGGRARADDARHPPFYTSPCRTTSPLCKACRPLWTRGMPDATTWRKTGGREHHRTSGKNISTKADVARRKHWSVDCQHACELLASLRASVADRNCMCFILTHDDMSWHMHTHTHTNYHFHPSCGPPW